MADATQVEVTADMLTGVREGGQLQFTPAEVEILCDLPEGAITETPELHREYLRGLLRMQKQMRGLLYRRCAEGDNSAMKIFLELASAVGVEHE